MLLVENRTVPLRESVVYPFFDYRENEKGENMN